MCEGGGCVASGWQEHGDLALVATGVVLVGDGWAGDAWVWTTVLRVEARGWISSPWARYFVYATSGVATMRFAIVSRVSANRYGMPSRICTVLGPWRLSSSVISPFHPAEAYAHR